MILRIFLLVAVLACLAGVGLVAYTVQREGSSKYSVSVAGIEIPGFTAIDVEFDHFRARAGQLPFTAGAIIDVDNDGREELFLGGGIRQADGIFRFQDDHFVNITDQVGLVKQGGDATYGAVVLDIDNNGFRDLIISRASGVWLYRNDGRRFTGERIDLQFPPGSVPLAAAITDLNGDGYFDMFIPVYRHEGRSYGSSDGGGPDEGGEGRLLINNGDHTFSDISAAVGIDQRRNIFQALFCDLDHDGLDDLVVLHDHGWMRIWKNRGDLLFEGRKHPFSNTPALFTGLAVGDYNNDGIIDIFVGNSGSTVPGFLTRVAHAERVPHVKWVLLKNNGGMVFTDDAVSTQLADYEMSRGAVFVDLNADSLMDLIVAQNDPDWPLHRFPFSRLPGRLFVQNNDGQFAETAAASGAVNRAFSTTPLLADFNNDGRPDIIHVNSGGRTRVFLSQGGGENAFLKVHLPDNASSLGAMVSVKTLSGKILRQPFLVGKELCSDSSHALFFGLGKDKAIEVMVQYRSGKTERKSGVISNMTIVFEAENQRLFSDTGRSVEKD